MKLNFQKQRMAEADLPEDIVSVRNFIGNGWQVPDTCCRTRRRCVSMTTGNLPNGSSRAHGPGCNLATDVADNRIRSHEGLCDYCFRM